MSEWVEVPKENHSELTDETIPWIMETVKDGRDIVMCSMSDLPPEAETDKKLFELQHLKSMLIIPLSFHNKIQGLLVLILFVYNVSGRYGNRRFTYYSKYLFPDYRTSGDTSQPGRIEETFGGTQHQI